VLALETSCSLKRSEFFTKIHNHLDNDPDRNNANPIENVRFSSVCGNPFGFWLQAVIVHRLQEFNAPDDRQNFQVDQHGMTCTSTLIIFQLDSYGSALHHLLGITVFWELK
jgi:hypothetical protein